MTDTTDPTSPDLDSGPISLPCVMTFNTNDPSGAGGLAADLTAMASASAGTRIGSPARIQSS